MNHLLRTAVLAYAQHGLTYFLLTEQLGDAHESVVVVFLDFSKAFDSV